MRLHVPYAFRAHAHKKLVPNFNLSTLEKSINEGLYTEYRNPARPLAWVELDFAPLWTRFCKEVIIFRRSHSAPLDSTFSVPILLF